MPGRVQLRLLSSVVAATGLLALAGPSTRPGPSGMERVAAGTLWRSSAPTYARTSALQVRQIGDRGDPAAQTEAGTQYHGFCSLGEDEVTAAERYRSAAEEGYAPAQHQLGYMYRAGLGVPRDEESGVGWFRLAAEQGYAPAQYELAYMYSFESTEDALAWYFPAAEQGYARAQTDLGERYARQTDDGAAYHWGSRFGVPPDEEAAARWYRLAAEQGYPRAQYRLARMYAEGRGVSRDVEEARRWYRFAAAQGYLAAQEQLDGGTRPARASRRTPASARPTNATETRLHRAAATGDVTRIGRLLDAGAALNTLDGNGHTPLHVAAAHGEVEAIRALIAGGADADVPTSAGLAPLHLAVVHDHVGAATTLIDAGADVNVGANYRVAPLHVAVGVGPRSWYPLYVDRDHLDDLAVRHSSLAVVRALLEAGANPNAFERIDGWTPLQHALIGGATVELVGALLTAGANPHLRARIVGDPGPDDFAGSPLYFAAWRGSGEAIQLLVAAGAQVNEPFGTGDTPLDEAVQAGHTAAAALLRALGARTCVELVQLPPLAARETSGR